MNSRRKTPPTTTSPCTCEYTTAKSSGSWRRGERGISGSRGEAREEGREEGRVGVKKGTGKEQEGQEKGKVKKRGGSRKGEGQEVKKGEVREGIEWSKPGSVQIPSKKFPDLLSASRKT